MIRALYWDRLGLCEGLAWDNEEKTTLKIFEKVGYRIIFKRHALRFLGYFSLLASNMTQM